MITDVEVTGDPQKRESEQYQGEFIGGIADVVVGQDIDEISGQPRRRLVAHERRLQRGDRDHQGRSGEPDAVSRGAARRGASTPSARRGRSRPPRRSTRRCAPRSTRAHRRVRRASGRGSATDSLGRARSRARRGACPRRRTPPPCSTPYAALSDATDGRRQPARRRRRSSALGYDAGYSLRRSRSRCPRRRTGASSLDLGRRGASRSPSPPSSTSARSARAASSTSCSASLTPHCDRRHRRRRRAATSRCAGAPQRIGLEHPFDPRRAIGVWEVTDAALCASATNRRAWGDGLHHVLDARTGQPVRTIAATWAVAADGDARRRDRDRAVLRRRPAPRPRVGRRVGADDDRRPRRVVAGLRGRAVLGPIAWSR